MYLPWLLSLMYAILSIVLNLSCSPVAGALVNVSFVDHSYDITVCCHHGNKVCPPFLSIGFKKYPSSRFSDHSILICSSVDQKGTAFWTPLTFSLKIMGVARTYEWTYELSVTFCHIWFAGQAMRSLLKKQLSPFSADVTCTWRNQSLRIILLIWTQNAPYQNN